MTQLRANHQPLSKPKFPWIILFGILVAFALYVYQIDGQSLWRDEALSIGRARQTVSMIFTNQNIIGDVAGPDLHPPLYFFFLHSWHQLVGESEFAWRYASALAMILALATFYAAGNRILGHNAGQWTLFLALLSPFFLWYAQEARMYALVVGESLEVLLATWFLLNHRSGWKGMVGFTLAIVLLVMTHYSGLFLAAFAVMAAVIAQIKKRFSSWLLVVPLVGGVLVLWLLRPYLLQLLTASGFVAFSQRPLWALAQEAINTFSLGSAAPMDEPGWRIWPFILLGLLGAWHGIELSKTRRRSTWFIIGGMVIPLLLIYLAALLQANYSNPRHLTILTAPWFLLMGQGLAELYRRWKPLALIALIFVGIAGGGTLYQTINEPPIKKDDVRGLAAYIEERMQPGDLVIWHDAIMMETYKYYAPDLPFEAIPSYGQSNEAAVQQTLAERTTQFERIWFVEQPAPFFFNDSLVRNWLDQRLVRTDFKTFAASWASLQLRLYVWPQQLTELPAGSFPADLSDGNYRVEGVFGENTAVSGQGTWLSVIWSGESLTAPPASVCLRLRDSASVIWADGCTHLDMLDNTMLVSSKMMVNQLWLPLPQGLAPTTYSIELLMNGRTQTIGKLPITAAKNLRPALDSVVEYKNGLRLVNAAWENDTLRAGLWAIGNLVWQTDAPLPDDLITSVRLIDWLGRSIAEETLSLPPVDYPGSQWQIGELVRSFVSIQLPFTNTGRYRIQIAVTNTAGTAVPTTGLFGRTWQTIGTVQIEPWPLIKELPAEITPVEDVLFGETIYLSGYDLVRANDVLTVKLYWLTAVETAVDYNVFIHVGQPGMPPLAQSSGGPANWTRPVSSWRAGEIVEDSHTITLSSDLPADALVIVGMFDPADPNVRVPVTAVNQPITNNAWPLGPLPVEE